MNRQSNLSLTRRRRVTRWRLLNLSEGIAIQQSLDIGCPVLKNLLRHFVKILRRGRVQCTVEDFKNLVVDVVVFKGMELVRNNEYVKPFLDEISEWLKITMEIVQNILVKFTRMLEDRPFVCRHCVHSGVEKAVYDSAQTIVLLLLLIFLLEFFPSNTTGSLPSEAYMDQDPEKGLEIMHSIMENIIIKIKVSFVRQDFTTGVWGVTLEVR